MCIPEQVPNKCTSECAYRDFNNNRVYYATVQEYEQVTASDHTEYTVNCVTLCCMLSGLERHQRGDCCVYEQRLS